MKLTIPRKELHEALQTVGRAVSQQTTLPVLKNVLIETDGDQIRLSATDLEMGMELLTPAQVETPGTLTVPARALAEMVASLPEADVHLTAGEKDTLTVQCRRSEFRIGTLPADDFPALPTVSQQVEFRIGQRLLKGMLRQVLFAVSGDDTRPILTGVCFILQDGTLKLVATDTHRLAVRTHAVAAATGNLTVIVPARTLNELLRVLSDDAEAELMVRAEANQVLFQAERVTVTSRVIEGQFPRYERVIPSSHTRRLTLQRDELVGALKRARIVAREAAAKDRVILAVQEGGLTGETLLITAEGEGGRAHEEIDCVRDGELVSVAFNVNYLVEILAAIPTDGVFIELTEPLSPVVVRPVEGPDYLTVIMPMQVH